MVVAASRTFNVRADHDDDPTYRARLSGFGEVPPKLVDGQGKFNGALSDDHTSIAWTVSWTGLTGPAQAAHIHFGQTQVNGSVVVFFCGGGGRPPVRTDPITVARSAGPGRQPTSWQSRHRTFLPATLPASSGF